MKFKATLYKKFPIIPHFNYKLGLKLHKYKLILNKVKVQKKLRQQKGLIVNIGCGEKGKGENWINLDYKLYKNVTFAYDCSKDLPFESGSVKFIFTEHFFEHLAYTSEAIPFLQESYRVLEKDGIIRIIIPDAGKYLLAYAEDGWSALKATRPLTDELIDLQMGYTYNTKMELINEVFRQSGEHKFAWDFDTLKFNLQRAGFRIIKQQAYGEGFVPENCLDLKVREPESLYVEGIK